MQKTWTQLLGKPCENCVVDGQFIVRRLTSVNWTILWTAESRLQALAIMEAWRAEKRKMIFETVVYCGAMKVFRVLNLSTGSIYSSDFATEDEANEAIEDGAIRGESLVKCVPLSDLNILLLKEFS